jgi:transposase
MTKASSICAPENLQPAQWKKQGLIIKYLPPYSPELNLIEILWRNIKYTWLPFSAYQCLNALGDALEHILKNFGSKYQITFA